MAVSKGTKPPKTSNACGQNSWAMFLHAGFVMLESRSCLFGIPQIVIPPGRPEPRPPRSMGLASSYASPCTFSLTPWTWPLGCRVRFCKGMEDGGRGGRRRHQKTLGMNSNVWAHTRAGLLCASPVMLRTQFWEVYPGPPCLSFISVSRAALCD